MFPTFQGALTTLRVLCPPVQVAGTLERVLEWAGGALASLAPGALLQEPALAWALWSEG